MKIAGECVLSTERQEYEKAIKSLSYYQGVLLVSPVTGMRKTSPWIHYDMMNNQFQILSAIPNPECPICGTISESSLLVGDS